MDPLRTVAVVADVVPCMLPHRLGVGDKAGEDRGFPAVRRVQDPVRQPPGRAGQHPTVLQRRLLGSCRCGIVGVLQHGLGVVEQGLERAEQQEPTVFAVYPHPNMALALVQRK